jgi:hypothetical protein
MGRQAAEMVQTQQGKNNGVVGSQLQLAVAEWQLSDYCPAAGTGYQIPSAGLQRPSAILDCM